MKKGTKILFFVFAAILSFSVVGINKVEASPDGVPLPLGFPQRIFVFQEQVTELDSGTVLITWETNMSTSGFVYYGKEDNVQTAFEIEEDGLLHAVVIEGLTAGQEYFFQTISKKEMFETKGERFVLKLRDELGQVVKNSEEQCDYLTEYLKKGKSNSPTEVIKLQTFLKDKEGFSELMISGSFDQATHEAVLVFQKKYKEDILEPWGISEPTGYVYITTTKKINEISCQREFLLTAEQKIEIGVYKEIPEEERSLKEVGMKIESKEFFDSSVVSDATSEGDLEADVLAAVGGSSTDWWTKVVNNLPKMLLVVFVVCLLILLYRSLKGGKNDRI